MFAVAVSGGSDSTALLVLAAETAPGRIRAVTVDHALRPEAAEEAQAVAALCARLGVPHTTLRWHRDGAPEGNLQAAARAARYALIRDWAAGQGIPAVLIAHTADDQAETFLMRLARRPGLDGLAAMRPRWQDGPVTFLRPLLHHRRAALRAELTRRAIPWIDDPSNSDSAFDRVRIRQALPHLAPLGLDAETLAATARHLAEARDALDQAVAAWADAHVSHDHAALAVPRPALAGQGPEVQRRLLAAMLRFIGGAAYPPRSEALARALTFTAGDAAAQMTLAGCLLRRGERTLTVTREAAALADVTAPPGAPWDRRIILEHPGKSGHSKALTIAALGPEGLRQSDHWRALGIPRSTAEVTPGVWDGPRLIAAPLAGWPNGWTARPAERRGSLAQFVLSD